MSADTPEFGIQANKVANMLRSLAKDIDQGIATVEHMTLTEDFGREDFTSQVLMLRFYEFDPKQSGQSDA